MSFINIYYQFYSLKKKSVYILFPIALNSHSAKQYLHQYLQYLQLYTNSSIMQNIKKMYYLLLLRVILKCRYNYYRNTQDILIFRTLKQIKKYYNSNM